MDSSVKLMMKHLNGETFNIKEYVESIAVKMVFIGSFGIDLEQHHEEGVRIEREILYLIDS